MMTVRFAAAMCVVAVGVCAAAESDETKAPAFEPVAADFCSVRGLNYIASYAPSDVAMWRFYDREQIDRELGLIRGNKDSSELYRYMRVRYLETDEPKPIMMNALKVACIAEKALSFLYAEQNLVSREQVIELVDTLGLDREYLERRLRDNGRVL